MPGSDPRTAYGDLVQRGVKGVVLEAYGEVSNSLMTWHVSSSGGDNVRESYAAGMQAFLSFFCLLGTHTRSLCVRCCDKVFAGACIHAYALLLYIVCQAAASITPSVFESSQTMSLMSFVWL